MTFSDVEKSINFISFSDSQKKQILGYLRDAYINSASAKKMLNKMSGYVLKIYNSPGKFQEDGIWGHEISIDLNFGNYYRSIDEFGRIQKFDHQIAILHEISHDVYNYSDGKLDYIFQDLVGANVRQENKFRAELNRPERVDYLDYVPVNMVKGIAVPVVTPGYGDKGFTNGNKVDYIIANVTKSNWKNISTDWTLGDVSRDLIIGDSRNNTYKAGKGNDFIYGAGGDDYLYGGDDQDGLFGGDDDDSIYGGDGNDTIAGGKGIDELYGGKGADIFKFAPGDIASGEIISGGDVKDIASEGNRLSGYGTLTFNLAKITAVSEILFEKVGRLIFEAKQVSETGINPRSNVFASAGQDELLFNIGTSKAGGSLDLSKLGFKSEIAWSATGDYIYLMGNGIADVITGTSQNDIITGGGGKDQIDGGAGKDAIEGGTGNDTLSGGTDNDHFIFRKADVGDTDTIADFKSGDKIDLRGFDANTSIEGTQPFIFIGKNEFKGGSAQVRIVEDKTSTKVLIDANGDKKADLTILIKNQTDITAKDFLGLRTNHSYEVVTVDKGLTWKEAKAAAEAKGGHLVTISGAAENKLVFDLVNNPKYWSKDGYHGVWLGGYQTNDSAGYAGNWKWVTGEKWDFKAWYPGQPDDSGTTLNEDSLEMLTSKYGPGTWNDIDGSNPYVQESDIRTFVVEYDVFV